MKRKILRKTAAVLMCAIIFMAFTSCSGEGKLPRVKFTWEKRDSIGTEATAQELDPILNGRGFYDDNGAYNFGFSAGGISFGFKGTELYLDLDECGSWLGVYIDDMEQILVVGDQKGYVKVAEGLNGNKIHDVTIGKRNEGNGHVGLAKIAKVKISDGGEFYVKEYKEERKRIQVLGDSIACGHGNVYDPENPSDNYLDNEDGTKTFATILADYYDAELDMSCISGIGIGNQYNSPYALLPTYKAAADGQVDFTKNIPQVVIIELGTNDCSLYNMGPEFVENGKEYISFIRGNYPDATIIWYYGIMNDGLTEKIEEIVKSFNDAGDHNVYCLFTAPIAEEGLGGVGHPNMVTHKRMAKELQEFIDQVVTW